MLRLAIAVAVGTLSASSVCAQPVIANADSAQHAVDIKKALEGIKPQQKEIPFPAGPTRMAVVNIGHVFNKYDRAIAFKKELETTIKPYKERAAVLQHEITKWTDEMRSPNFDPKKKNENEEKIGQNKQHLENLQIELQRLIGKKQEENLITLWKEVQTGVQVIALENKIQVVFGFGEPLEKETLDLLPNVNRKMGAMDAGGTVPLFVAPGMDIAPAVIDWLHKKSQGKKQEMP